VEPIALADVCEALEHAPPDQLFTTRGRVVAVHRVHRSCYFTLTDDGVELPCAMLRRQAARTDFWVRVGQEIEVTGRAEQFRGRWQLFVEEARLVENVTDLAEVSASLQTAPPDRLFTTRGKVAAVHRVSGSCYFTLAQSEVEGGVRLKCALLRRQAARTDFWVSVGQTVEVTGHAENFRGRWQLYVLEARLVSGGLGWPRGYRYRPARRVVAWFDALVEALFGPSRA
jgi:exonuclease VII large subunit